MACFSFFFCFAGSFYFHPPPLSALVPQNSHPCFYTQSQVHDNVRGKDVYIIQPTSSPVNEHLMELLLMVSTMRRASAGEFNGMLVFVFYSGETYQGQEEKT